MIRVVIAHTIDNSIRGCFENLIDKFVTERLTDVWCCPEDLDIRFLRKYVRHTRADAAPGAHDEDASEHLDDGHHAQRWDAAHPDFLWGVLDQSLRPVACIGNDHREACLARLADSSEGVPIAHGTGREADVCSRERLIYLGFRH